MRFDTVQAARGSTSIVERFFAQRRSIEVNNDEQLVQQSHNHRRHLQRNQTRYKGKAMNPKATHRVFGEVKVLTKRVTAGGNEVHDAICSDGQRRVLLTNEEYWENEAVRSSTAPSICGFSPWLSLIESAKPIPA
jgi:hypothetical protein